MPDPDSSLDPEFRAGDRIRTEIGEFEVQRVLGEGGMGVVYQVVRDERHGGRQFALKTILPELLNRREVVERFEAEGRILAKFDHENIIKIDGIYTMQSRHPRPFILMELLQGYTLRYVMDQYEEPLSVLDVCTVAIGVCNALEEIHKSGVIHRDIKPENIFIQKRRKHTRVVLIDFGIMKLILGEAAGKNATRFFLGSYSNASPEQLLGQDVTPRSDFYSLGTALYEMLTGGTVFPDVTESRAIGQAHVDRKPVPLHERAPHVPREIADIVMQALEKDVNARPKDVHLFRQPFTTVRNRILRDQAASAGHSTIERFLTNTVGAERLPPLSAERGHTVKLPAIQSEARDTTTPSEAPYGGTQPDRAVGPVDALSTQKMNPSASALITRPDKPPRPAVEESSVYVVGAPAGTPAAPPVAVVGAAANAPPVPRVGSSEWEPSLFSGIPIQPDLPAGGVGTDPTSAKDLPARSVPRVDVLTEGGRDEEIRLPIGRPRLPRILLGISAAAAILVSSLFVVRGVQRSKDAASPVETVQARLSPPADDSAPVPSPLPPPPAVLSSPTALAASTPLPETQAISKAAPSSVDAGASSEEPAPAASAHHSSHGHHSQRANPSAAAGPPASVTNLFEDIQAVPAPAPSASSRKMPGGGL